MARKKRHGIRKLTLADQKRAMLRWSRQGAAIPNGWIPPMDYADAGNIARFEFGTEHAGSERAALNADAPRGEYLMSGGIPVDETPDRFCQDAMCGARLVNGSCPWCK